MQNSQSKTLNILILFLPSCNAYRFYMKKIPNPPALAFKERALLLTVNSKLTVRCKPCGWPRINIPTTITSNTGSLTLAEAQYFILHTRHLGDIHLKEGNSYFVEWAQEGKLERIKTQHTCEDLSENNCHLWSSGVIFEGMTPEMKISNHWRSQSMDLYSVTMLCLWIPSTTSHRFSEVLSMQHVTNITCGTDRFANIHHLPFLPFPCISTL